MTEAYRSRGGVCDEDEYLTAEVLGCGEVLVTVVDGDRSDLAVYLTVEDAVELWRWLGNRLGLDRPTDLLEGAMHAAGKSLPDVIRYATYNLGSKAGNLAQIADDPELTRAVLVWLQTAEEEPF